MKTSFKPNFAKFFLFLIISLSLCRCDGLHIKPTAPQGGNVNLAINGLNALISNAGAQFISVTFSGKIGKTTDGSGDPSFVVTQKFEIDPSGNITPGTTLQRIDLQPGTWSVTAQVNSWSKTCTGQISKGKGAIFTFTYNTNSCNVQ